MIVRALVGASEGIDLADALHLSASDRCEALISFDADLAKIAKKLRAGRVRRP